MSDDSLVEGLAEVELQAMADEITETQRELLDHARWTCGCESYYRFRCSKCKQTGQGFVTDRQEALDGLKKAGLVYHNSYHCLRPTKLGAAISELLGIKVWSCRIGGAEEHE